jgi:hypothetical protein
MPMQQLRHRLPPVQYGRRIHHPSRRSLRRRLFSRLLWCMLNPIVLLSLIVMLAALAVLFLRSWLAHH